MNKYIYTDKKTGEVDVFFAPDLGVADKLYEYDYGVNPAKLAHVGCEIEFGVN